MTTLTRRKIIVKLVAVALFTSFTLQGAMMRSDETINAIVKELAEFIAKWGGLSDLKVWPADNRNEYIQLIRRLAALANVRKF